MRPERGRGPATLFGMTQPSPYRYFRASPEIIRLAVTLCIRFPLSLRNMEDLLHERRIEVIHTTQPIWPNFRSSKTICKNPLEAVSCLELSEPQKVEKVRRQSRPLRQQPVSI